MHEIYTDQQAVDILLTEGHDAGDIAQELDILLRAGLVLSQPPDTWLLTEDEVDLMRLRLCEQGE